ncbi:hypothetical protein LSTR_LSTR005764 [Laodelphax striatellus]|uniref:CCHC-type domain-containing protein n=1 Tax=Laodelphax striatellus TaxID=195883 RepID=A0A482X0S1_LAOST|nr:hypothetical protein LSTR_LSTR005764 [Laodelphax striatellus]
MDKSEIVNTIFLGEVLNVHNYGAFVSIPGRREQGLVHRSQISSAAVDDASEVLQRGDRVWCKVIEITDDGKVSLSMKVVQQGSGKDLDPTGVQIHQDKVRRMSQPQSGGRRTIKLEAVLNTTCSKCGTRGHLASNCFQSRGGKTYELLPEEDDEEEEEVMVPSSTDNEKAKRKRDEKRREKEEKRRKKKAKKEKKAARKAEKKEMRKAKKKRSRSSSSDSSSSSSESEEEPKKKKRKREKSRERLYSHFKTRKLSDSVNKHVFSNDDVQTVRLQDRLSCIIDHSGGQETRRLRHLSSCQVLPADYSNDAGKSTSTLKTDDTGSTALSICYQEQAIFDIPSLNQFVSISDNSEKSLSPLIKRAQV